MEYFNEKFTFKKTNMIHFLSPDSLFLLLGLARCFPKDREKDSTREKKLDTLKRLQIVKNLLKKGYRDISGD